jgi:hypothetical protein
MKRNRTRGITLSLGILALAVAGCGKDKKVGEGAATAAGAAAGMVAAAGGGASAFALIPKESMLMVGINMSGLRGTKLWDTLMPMVKQQGAKELSEFSELCGIDAFDVIESVVIGGDPEKNNLVAVFKSKANKSKVVDCTKKMAAKDGTQLAVSEDGNLVQFAPAGEPAMWVAFLDDNTIVTGAGAQGDTGKEWLRGVLAAKAPVTGNAELMALVNETDTSAGIWFAAAPPAEDMTMMAAGGAPPKAFFGSVSMKAGLKVNGGARFESADGAKAMADQLNTTVTSMSNDPMMGKYAKKTSISPDGNTMRVKVELDQAEVDELVGMVQQQLPMLMMMMGGGM